MPISQHRSLKSPFTTTHYTKVVTNDRTLKMIDCSYSLLSSPTCMLLSSFLKYSTVAMKKRIRHKQSPADFLRCFQSVKFLLFSGSLCVLAVANWQHCGSKLPLLQQHVCVNIYLSCPPKVMTVTKSRDASKNASNTMVMVFHQLFNLNMNMMLQDNFSNPRTHDR